MKIEKTSESSNSGETPSQRQDPLERRRLQNRLSQRNHRRKIRDRIAKLQERVIANELRAAAALNGWDQQFTPSPLISTRQSTRYEPNCHVSRDPSPLNNEPTMPFPSSFNEPSSWSSDMTVPPPPAFSGDSTYFNDGLPAPPAMSPISHLSIPSRGSGLDGDAFRGVSATTGSPLWPESFHNAATDQLLCYAATEAALPQIVQVLSTMAPQSKIIILVPPDSTSTSMAGYPSPTPTLPTHNETDTIPSTPMNMPSGVCHFQAQNANPAATAQMGSKGWTAPGSYFLGSSPHRSPDGDFLP